MKIPYSWLEEINGRLPAPGELADLLLRAGLEVEETLPLVCPFSNVVTARIIAMETIPDDPHNLLVRVEAGPLGFYQVVSGAPNLAVGLVTPLALPGAILPGKAIERRSFSGAESEGMLCSRAELGLEKELLPVGEEGVVSLPEESPLGADLGGLLGLPDTLFTIKVTANRPDWNSVLGLAREIAVFTGEPLRPLLEFQGTDSPTLASTLVAVEVEDPLLCLRYLATVICDTQIKPSPLWLASRLWKSGMRPISNVVDVTNYVMLEVGQPLHPFDLDQVAERRIVVRQARPEETLVTLDGTNRTLAGSVLLITDPQKGLGIAGVMGGLNSEMTPATRSLVLESAYFQSASIRRTSRLLGLKTEASERFVRGVSHHSVEEGSRRATAMLASLAGGRVLAGRVDCGRPPPPKRLRIRPERTNQILATDLSREEIFNSLNRLGLSPQGETIFEVESPPWRQDLHEEVDLIEDIARLIGYDRVPHRMLAGPLRRGTDPSWRRKWPEWRTFLLGQGLTEVVTAPLVPPEWNTFTFLEVDQPFTSLEGKRPMVLRNPISPERSALRLSLLPSLLQVVAANQNRGHPLFGCVELGKAYRWRGEEELPDEPRLLALAVAVRQEMDWQGGTREMNLFRLKGWLEILFHKELRFQPIPYEHDLHPGRSAALFHEDRLVGVFGEIGPALGKRFALKEGILLAEIAIESFLGQAVPRFQSFSRFPAADRDVALVVSTDAPYSRWERVIREAGGPLLKQVTFFDRYQGENIRPGTVSLAFSLRFLHSERTLTEAEVSQAMASIERSLEEHGAVLRSR
ncbi:MAG: phenylalanine--tRNA ligase subunit beta [Coprothermobacterota bacterium]|nr:phenylalanine--tRNA ligase subunit beta [Coprothermobacterota bacterium]